MGNRAIITTKEEYAKDGIAVYLHWNGGRDSVEAFLKYCKLKGYRPPETDCYGWARLCQVIGNFFGGTCSIGIDNFRKEAGQYQDNGTYIIKNWEIVDRKFYDGAEQHHYDLEEMLLEIDASQPKEEQLGEFLTATEVPTSEITIGTEVWFIDSYDGKPTKHTVMGIGKDEYVNGTNVKGIPYVDLYGSTDRGYSWNINNYIRTETVRRI